MPTHCSIHEFARKNYLEKLIDQQILFSTKKNLRKKIEKKLYKTKLLENLEKKVEKKTRRKNTKFIIKQDHGVVAYERRRKSGHENIHLS